MTVSAGQRSGATEGKFEEIESGEKERKGQRTEREGGGSLERREGGRGLGEAARSSGASPGH